MDEILALQQELAAAQRTTTSQKLSERNCIELVMKLQSLNLIDLIFTRSGKEYLTPVQLDRELEDELLTRGGRVNVTDLPDALNIALAHIEAAVSKLLAADPRVRLVRGELITDDYLEALVSDIDDALAASPDGTDSLADVATRHALPVDLVRDTLAASTSLSAHFDRASGSLTSPAAASRHRAQARGLLRGTATPTPLAELAAHAAVPLQTLREEADELLRTGLLRGSIEGRAARALFVPEVFTRAAAETLVADFSANSFVRLDAIARLHVPDVKGFVAQHFPDAIVLSDCVVQPVVRDTLATTASEALAAGGWLDVVAAMPAGFPDGDVTPFVAHVAASVEATRAAEPGAEPAQNGAANGSSGGSKGRRRGKTAASKSAAASKPSVLFADQFVVSPQAAKLLEDRVVKHATEQAAEHAKEMAAKMETVGNQAEISRPAQDQGEAEREKEGGKKGKGKGRRRAGGKDKGAGKGGVAQTDSSTVSQLAVTVPTLEEVVELVFTDDGCGSLAESDYLEQSAAGDEMVHAVLEASFGDAGLHALFTTKAAEAVETLERERVQARKEAELALLTDLQCAELFARTAGYLADPALASAARVHALDSRCVDIVCRVVHAAAQSTGVVLPGAARAHALPSRRAKLDFVRAACTDLAPTVAAKVRDLVAAATHSGKDSDEAADDDAVESFLLEYDGAVTMLDLPERRPLDKKSERATLANLRAQLVASFDDTLQSESAALKTAVVLTHAKSSSGSVVDFAPDDCARFCEAVAEGAKPPEAGTLLLALRAIASARAGTEKNGADGDAPTGLSTEFAEKLAELREHIG